LTAIGVAVTGTASQARAWLSFDFGGVPREPEQVVTIAVHNAKFAAATLAGAAAVPHLGSLRLATDVILGSLLVLNACVIGFALGAYGSRIGHALAPHVPLEFGALSLAGGAYLTATHQSLTGRQLAATGAGCVSMLVAAAVIETYLSPTS